MMTARLADGPRTAVYKLREADHPVDVG